MPMTLLIEVEMLHMTGALLAIPLFVCLKAGKLERSVPQSARLLLHWGRIKGGSCSGVIVKKGNFFSWKKNALPCSQIGMNL